MKKLLLALIVTSSSIVFAAGLQSDCSQACDNDVATINGQHGFLAGNGTLTLAAIDKVTAIAVASPFVKVRVAAVQSLTAPTQSQSFVVAAKAVEAISRIGLLSSDDADAVKSNAIDALGSTIDSFALAYVRTLAVFAMSGIVSSGVTPATSLKAVGVLTAAQGYWVSEVRQAADSAVIQIQNH